MEIEGWQFVGQRPFQTATTGESLGVRTGEWWDLLGSRVMENSDALVEEVCSDRRCAALGTSSDRSRLLGVPLWC